MKASAKKFVTDNPHPACLSCTLCWDLETCAYWMCMAYGMFFKVDKEQPEWAWWLSGLRGRWAT